MDENIQESKIKRLFRLTPPTPPDIMALVESSDI